MNTSTSDYDLKDSLYRDIARLLYSAFIRGLARSNTLPSKYSLTLRSKLLEGFMHGSVVATEEYTLTLRLPSYTKLTVQVDTSLKGLRVELAYEYKAKPYIKLVALSIAEPTKDNLAEINTNLSNLVFKWCDILNYYIFRVSRALTEQEAEDFIQTTRRLHK